MSDPYNNNAPPLAPARQLVVGRSSTAGWWVAAVVAIVAIVGVVLLVTRSGPTPADLQAARDQGAVEANLTNAAQSAQQAAATAAQSAQNAAAGAAAATESAAQAAAQKTEQAVDATAAAASDVTEPVEPR